MIKDFLLLLLSSFSMFTIFNTIGVSVSIGIVCVFHEAIILM
jgi:hypothetical protein